MFTITFPVHASAERIWEVLSDVERWPDWTTSMQEIERLEPGALAVGSTAKVKQPKLPAAIWRVTASEPGRSFTWEARTAGFTTVGDHRIDSSADGSLVTLSIRRSGPLARLADLLFGRIDRRYVTIESEGLRRHVEVAAPA